MKAMTYPLDAVRTGHKVVIGDTMKGIMDQCLKHLMDHEQDVLRARTLNCDQDFCGSEQDILISKHVFIVKLCRKIMLCVTLLNN